MIRRFSGHFIGDTIGITMNVVEKHAIKLLKDKARSIHLTQQKVATELDVSLPTVKRWWSGKGVNLTVISRLCGLVGVSLSQLFVEMEGESSNYTYTLIQERMLESHPKILALFDLLVSGDSPETIQRRFSINDDEMFAMLVKLDRVGLIELHEGNRVKVKKGEPQWIVGGPLSLKYRKKMIEAFLGEHPKANTTFYIHDYLPEDLLLIRAKMKELESMMSAFNARGAMNKGSATSYGAYFAFKKFEWDLRDVLRNKK